MLRTKCQVMKTTSHELKQLIKVIYISLAITDTVIVDTT